MHFLVMTLLGVVLFGFAIRLMINGRRSRTWQAVEGEILGTVKEREFGPASRRQKVDRLMVRYRYVVSGRECQNDKVRFKWTHQNVAEEARKYFPGKKVMVYVNPDDLSQTVLEPGVDASNYIALLGGIFFMVAGVVLAIYAE